MQEKTATLQPGFPVEVGPRSQRLAEMCNTDFWHWLHEDLGQYGGMLSDVAIEELAYRLGVWTETGHRT